ncbi:MAG TPA: hypothetical protein VLA88_05995, partial [Candidatus Saccharimonadales bacterium]|nr:hypothetical protein [Candidatus Saccharimonadales bacterium]
EASRHQPEVAPLADDADRISDLVDLAGVSLARLMELSGTALDKAMARILKGIDSGADILSSWSSYADR